MNVRIQNYLEGIFAQYEPIGPISELKEELSANLQERFDDLKATGLDDETAFARTIASIGEISDLIEGISTNTRKLQKIVGMNFSMSNLQKSDLRSIEVHDGKFNYCNLQDSDFSHSDLSHSSFKSSNLDRVKFDNANLTGAKIIRSNLRGASFANCRLDHVDFHSSDLSGVCMDNLTFNGTDFSSAGLKGTSFRNAVFHNVSFKTDVKKAIFDGAVMDKATYAILKGYKADVSKVTVV
ncbi:pentapeptide repeat-containing protein [Brevibacillus fluminis]|uniref:pentapeptide repeat-containing protein n=1 Tax=Brevibacillus fluminis TaxID=511487 RepID=UPI003F8B80B5